MLDDGGGPGDGIGAGGSGNMLEGGAALCVGGKDGMSLEPMGAGLTALCIG